MASIVIDRVTKTFGDVIAVYDASMEVRDGEFVVLVGPSGCGKSTLLRLVAGLGDYSAGTVAVEGLPPARARAERGDMAFVFQDATLLPWRTVRANVELPLELKGAPAGALLPEQQLEGPVNERALHRPRRRRFGQVIDGREAERQRAILEGAHLGRRQRSGQRQRHRGNHTEGVRQERGPPFRLDG